jgi:hypothetical protein
MIPPYNAFSKLIAKVDDANGQEFVQIPKDLFRLILREAARTLPFDEAYYLSENSDLAAAKDADPKFEPHEHFIRSGYIEGRKPAVFEIDKRWYLRTYPDVAAAVEQGLPASASEHFNRTGWPELRAPNAKSFAAITEWVEVIGNKFK